MIPASNIRLVQPTDAQRLTEIYNHYILHTHITFELEPIDATEMARRIETISERYPYLVIELDDVVQGYAYCSPWKARAAYAMTVESTIYLAAEVTQKGIGTQLYSALIEEARKRGYHSLIGGIALPNDASIRLHEKLGYVKVADFKEMGFKFGRWIDTPYWQLMLMT